MPRFAHRSVQVLMLMVLFVAAGGHWIALQSLAWSHMLLSYSQDGSFVEAVTRTFDGRHPCSLCKKIENAGHTEKIPKAASQEARANFLVPPVIVLVAGERVAREFEIVNTSSPAREESPATPPPRSAAV